MEQVDVPRNVNLLRSSFIPSFPISLLDRYNPLANIIKWLTSTSKENGRPDIADARKEGSYNLMVWKHLIKEVRQYGGVPYCIANLSATVSGE